MSHLTSPSAPVFLFALGIIALILVRQLQASRLSPARLLALPAALGFFAIQDSAALAGVDAPLLAMLAIAVALGIGMGVARAFTVRIWRAADGSAWSQGTWMTLALWGALIAARAAMGLADHSLGLQGRALTAELIWTGLSTIAAQNLVVWLRAAAATTPAAVRQQ